MAPASTPWLGKEVIVDMGLTLAGPAAALELGYDVVAEANPRLSAWAKQSEPFKSALATGRLTLPNRLVVDVPHVRQYLFYGQPHRNVVPYSCYAPPCEKFRCQHPDKLVVDYSPLYIKIDDDKGDVVYRCDPREHETGRGTSKYISHEAAPRGLPSDKIKELLQQGAIFQIHVGAKSKGHCITVQGVAPLVNLYLTERLSMAGMI